MISGGLTRDPDSIPDTEWMNIPQENLIPCTPFWREKDENYPQFAPSFLYLIVCAGTEMEGVVA